MFNSINELISYEKNNKIFDIRFKGSPLWMYLREKVTEDTIIVDPPVVKLSVIGFIKSILVCLKIFIQVDRNIYVISNRTELKAYVEKYGKKSITLVFDENNERKSNTLIFLIIRFICRKLSYIFFYNEYKNLQIRISSIRSSEKLKRNAVRNVIGDRIYISFLNLLFRKRSIFYSSPIIPGNIRFIENLNSTYSELQHGVIHHKHLGYCHLPEIHTNLIVYSDIYKKILVNIEYKASIVVKQWLNDPVTKSIYHKVIFTQPILELQYFIKDMVDRDKELLIQKHPRDMFNYGVDESRYISIFSIHEVEIPIFYSSSLIEKCLLNNKSFRLIDLNLPNFDSHFDIYKMYQNFNELVLRSN